MTGGAEKAPRGEGVMRGHGHSPETEAESMREDRRKEERLRSREPR